MTYREAIQIQINALQEVYDNCEGLRDAATDKEKDCWNDLRRKLPSLWQSLQRLDNSISDARGSYQLKGIYHINTNE